MAQIGADDRNLRQIAWQMSSCNPSWSCIAMLTTAKCGLSFSSRAIVLLDFYISTGVFKNCGNPYESHSQLYTWLD